MNPEQQRADHRKWGRRTGGGAASPPRRSPGLGDRRFGRGWHPALSRMKHRLPRSTYRKQPCFSQMPLPASVLLLDKGPKLAARLWHRRTEDREGIE